MKKYTKILLAAMAAMTLAGCTNDDNTAGMPDGKTPVTLTATCASTTTTTRTTIEGTWDWTDGIQVGVMIGDKVKPYDINISASTSKEADLTSTDPHYWTKAKELVTAWYPYNGETALPEVTVKDDQYEWEDYLASDCLAAVEQEVTYGGSTALEFSHRTAKIEITITNQNGGTDLPNNYTVKEVTISTDGGNRVIKTCPALSSSWKALIPPTTTAANDLIIMVTLGNDYYDDSNNKKYRYKHPEPQEFKANTQYALTLKVGEHDLVLADCTIKPWESATDTPETEIIEQKDFFVVDGVYHVKTAAGLKAWAKEVNNTVHTDDDETDIDCILENDIDMTDVTWEPVKAAHGAYDNYFRGTFNGNGHTISNLTINTTSTRAAGTPPTGFIGTLNGGTVKNLTLRNVNITGKSYTGAIVGSCINGSYIYCCQVTGKVTGTSSVGGIVGCIWNSKILACSSMCDVTGTVKIDAKNIGGIIGEANGATVISCYANGKLSMPSESDNNNYMGGITGYDDNGIYTACYWNCTGADQGVYNGSVDPSDVQKLVSYTIISYETAAAAMNDALKEQRYIYDIFYKWEVNNDQTTAIKEPFILKKKQ